MQTVTQRCKLVAAFSIPLLLRLSLSVSVSFSIYAGQIIMIVSIVIQPQSGESGYGARKGEKLLN